MNHYVRDGLSQAGRRLKALQDDYVTVDEQTLPDLLLYGARYSSLIRYYSEHEKTPQNWEPFFLGDEAILLSLVLKFDLPGLEKRFLRITEITSGSKSIYVSALIRQAQLVASTVNNWHQNLTPAILSPGNRFSAILEGVIQKSLVKELHSLISFQKLTAKGNPNRVFNTTGFGHVWNLPEAQLYTWERSPVSFSRLQIRDYFKSVFYAFYNAIAYLQEVAPSCLAESLVNQDHPAQSSLFIAFARLYLKSQETINNFTKRHFDFYYNNILHVTPRSFKADRVCLLIAPQPPGGEVLLASGTGFLAGKDLTKKDLVYLTTMDVVLNSAKIRNLRTLFLEKNKLISPASELGFITSVITSEVPIPDKAVSESDQPVVSRPLFGAPGPGHTGIRENESADLGFAAASNILLLKEGTRTIRCAISFTTVSFSEFDTLMRQMASFTERPAQEVFEKVFQDGFYIYMTTKSGWYRIVPQDIDCSMVNPAVKENTIELFFRLESDDPSFIPYQPEIHGGNLDTRLPVMKFVCNPNAYQYLYSLVKDLVVKTIRFEVEVKGVTNLTLYNKLGKLNPVQAFQPFGISPALGSWIIIGSYETRSKKVSSLSLAIEWADLPKVRGGFEEYYASYYGGIRNDSFKVKAAALEKGRWAVPASRKDEEYQLFRYDENSGQLEAGTLLENICTPMAISPDFLQDEEDFLYDNNTQSGFIRLTLSSPSIAFGNAEYSNLISNTIFANARKKVPLPMPNIPYNPSIARISLNYKANAEIMAYHSKSTGTDKFHPAIYHIHPWGFDRIFPSIKGKPNYLFPRYDDDGNLFIGIADFSPPSTVSLFFHLKNDAVNGSQVVIPEPKWFYLENNEWRQLKKHEIISDSTGNFLNSGIITISVPAPEEQEVNTIFPEPLTWLKVSLEANAGAVCSLIDLRTQVVEAVWVNDNNSFEHLKTSLLPGSIQKTKVPVAGIREIFQPMSSFGGVLPENPGEIYRRISERVKHKNRTGSGYDYEQIILQNFPEIMKVKCFPNLTSANRIKPGSVLISVIPYPKSVKKKGVAEEPFANSSLLHRIKTFAESISSPFAAIEVCNPVYEKIMVHCNVKLEKGIEGGYFLEKLNDELIERLSPWGKFEEDRPRFGETIRCADILSFIQNRSYIKFVTGFSILQITEDGNGFASVVDTVSPGEGEDAQPELKWELEPSFPSSILISAAKHSIDVIPSEIIIQPAPSGINRLELDETFIIR